MDGGAPWAWERILYLGEVSRAMPKSSSLASFHGPLRSVHNTRIERLWYDITNGFGRKWKVFFHDLEVHHGLDPSRASHIWLIHHLYLECIDEDAQEWAEAWNAHKMEIPGRGSQSPREMYMFRMVQQGPRGIHQLLTEPIDEEVEDLDSYGIDWDVHDDPSMTEHLLQSHTSPVETDESNPFGNSSTPHQLSEVRCESPACPLSTDQLTTLNTLLASRVDLWSRNMTIRRILWNEALAICAGFYS